MIPEILPYPQLLPAEKAKLLEGKLCYFIEPYPLEGIAAVVFLSKGLFHIKASRWSGTTISAALDLTKIKKGTPEAEIFAKFMPKIIGIMKYTKIIQAEFYFSQGKTLVDIRLSANKFMGPGMLRDIFGKVLETQKVIKTAPVSDEELKGATAILKPSAYKTIMADEGPVPFYCKL